MPYGPWDWLEVAKLCTGLLTPIVVAVIGIYIHRVTTRFEQLQWRSQKLTEKRLEIYDAMAPELNDLLCYFTYVGAWRDIDPPKIITMKRAFDKKIHLAAPLFSDEFFGACMDFQNLCFKTYAGWGEDAKLRTQVERRKQSRISDWNQEWNQYFCNDIADPKEIRIAYKRVMESFASNVGVHPTFVVPPSGRVPGRVL